MQKNTAAKWIVFAFQDEGGTNPGEPVTGDAANITANVHIDGGAANAVDDTNPAELAGGYYVFDITAVENNGDLIAIVASSSTANVNVIGVPGAIYTTPANFPALGIEADGDLTKVNTLNGHTAQTGDSFARLGAPAGASVSADVAAVKAETADILTDTGTTLPATLSTIDGNVDSVLSDTGTTLPATLSTIAGYIDTEVAAIKAVTDNLPDSGALTSIAQASALATVDTVVDNLNLGIIYGAAATGTLSTTQATTDLTGYADDQLIGRHITVTSGPAEGEQSDITDYAETGGLLTFTALTTAMANGDTFKIT